MSQELPDRPTDDSLRQEVANEADFLSGNLAQTAEIIRELRSRSDAGDPAAAEALKKLPGHPDAIIHLLGEPDQLQAYLATKSTEQS